MAVMLPSLCWWLLLVSALTILLQTTPIESKKSSDCDWKLFPPSPRDELITHYQQEDEGPQYRWSGVLERRAPQMMSLLKKMKTVARSNLGDEGFELVLQTLPIFYDSLEPNYCAEIEGISSLTGMPVMDVVFYNLYLEAHLSGISLMALGNGGRVYHARSVSVQPHQVNGSSNSSVSREELQSLLVSVEWFREARVQYSSLHVAGFIGVHTAAKKQGSVALTVDRRLDSRHTSLHLLAWVADGAPQTRKWSSLVAREAIENGVGFAGVVAILCATPLITPAYYTVTGPMVNQGVVITRETEAYTHTHMDPVDFGTWFVVQTNYDIWRDPKDDATVRLGAQNCMSEGQRANASTALLYSVLASRPVKDQNTVFVATLLPVTGQIKAWRQHG